MSWVGRPHCGDNILFVVVSKMSRVGDRWVFINCVKNWVMQLIKIIGFPPRNILFFPVINMRANISHVLHTMKEHARWP